MPASANCVDPKQVHLIWYEVAHWIKRAMERGDLGRFDAVQDDVLNGRALLWLVYDGQIIGAAVTQIGFTERTKACVIVACGGKGEWPHLIETIEKYARAEGCDAVRIFGRTGWARKLPTYRAAKIVLERRI
jgi:hypothetical protein